MSTWDQINFETATWAIPATRMKTGTEYLVPLSAQAMAILVYARGQSDDLHGSIFPPQHGQPVLLWDGDGSHGHT